MQVPKDPTVPLTLINTSSIDISPAQLWLFTQTLKTTHLPQTSWSKEGERRGAKKSQLSRRLQRLSLRINLHKLPTPTWLTQMADSVSPYTKVCRPLENSFMGVTFPTPPFWSNLLQSDSKCRYHVSNCTEAVPGGKGVFVTWIRSGILTIFVGLFRLITSMHSLVQRRASCSHPQNSFSDQMMFWTLRSPVGCYALSKPH